MPSQPPPRGNKQYPLQWVHIDDFSAGCYDGSHISLEQPTDGAPLGAGYLPGTFACASIPGGPLGPLPTIVTTYPLSLVGLPGTATYGVVTAFIITPQLNDGNYETVFAIEADDGSHHYVTFYSHEPATSAIAQIGGPTSTNPSTGPGLFGSPYPAYTRMTPSGTGNPPPVLVFPTAVATDPHGTRGHLWVYPSLAAPTTLAADDLVTGSSGITGQVVTYGNRVICLSGINYSWPRGGGVNTNENFNYTDPPESNQYGNQQTIMAIESPWGYGAWGTMSVGELFLVKKYGGGVILNGDINVPSSIIRIPGVQPTGDFVGQACSTPSGLIYCSQNRGAWLWNGGDVSQKISQNIHDSFFDLETNVINSNNYGFNVSRWNKFVLFSNNICWDTDTGGWWKLFPNNGQTPVFGVWYGPLGRDLWWYSQTQNGNQLAAAPLRVTNPALPLYSVFDNTAPAQTYQWQSLPMQVSEHGDRVIDVRQVVVRASDPTVGGSTGNAQVRILVGLSEHTSTDTINASTTPIRFNIGAGAQSLTEINLTLIALNSNGAAPIIHSVDIGYIVRAGLAVND